MARKEKTMEPNEFQMGDRVNHTKYGSGTLVGGFHLREDQKYYWNVEFDTGYFNYIAEDDMRVIKEINIVEELTELILSAIDRDLGETDGWLAKKLDCPLVSYKTYGNDYGDEIHVNIKNNTYKIKIS